MAMFAGVWASCRFAMLRFVRGNRPSRLSWRIRSTSLALAPCPIQSLGKRREAEARKILMAAGNVEVPVHQMRRRPRPRQAGDAHLRTELFRDHVGDVVKRGRD